MSRTAATAPAVPRPADGTGPPDAELATAAERILGAPEGTTLAVDVDLVFAHDATMPLAIESLAALGFDDVFDPDRVRVFFDHAYPAPTTQVADLQARVRRWCADHGVRLEEGAGICHQRLVEDGGVRPGWVVVGGDSHTNTLGALGAYATGMGSTDVAVALGTGQTWLTVPGTLRVEVRPGTEEADADTPPFPPGVSAKDAALEVVGRLGLGGASGRVLEWGGLARRLPLADRLTLANLTTECGAETGLIDHGAGADADGTADGAGEDRDPEDRPGPAPDLTVDLAMLGPRIAMHPRPDDVHPVEDALGIPVDQVMLGSCTNGRVDDFAAFADVLDRALGPGERVRARTVAVPASRVVLERIVETGVHARLVRRGVSVQSPGCGPCLGRHQGVLGDGEVAVTTTNRNYVGRMGSPESEVHLASPLTAAATAASGEVADPRTVLEGSA